MLDSLFQLLESSLDDVRLSRNESSVFKDMLEEASLTKRERDLLRRKIYELAEQHTKDPRDKDVLAWLEDIHKVMDRVFVPREHRFDSFFFPNENAFFQILEVLGGARKSIDICVFTITDNRIASTIMDRHDAGVRVRVITDDDKAGDLGSDVIDLARQGVHVRFDDSPDHMHHKFAIIDGELLLNGSFNWTRSASIRNQENIVITDQPRLIRDFQGEFDKLWKQFSP